MNSLLKRLNESMDNKEKAKVAAEAHKMAMKAKEDGKSIKEIGDMLKSKFGFSVARAEVVSMGVKDKSLKDDIRGWLKSLDEGKDEDEEEDEDDKDKGGGGKDEEEEEEED